jgi:threonine/homoserine/homoserine lactone efflux protein
MAFRLGWVLGLLLVGVIVFLIPASQTERGAPTVAAGYLRIGIGVLLLYLAAMQWRNRPGPADVVEVPKLLAGLDTFNGPKSLLTGVLMVVVNPKNLLLCAAGAAAIDLNTPNLWLQFGAYAVFTLIASSTVAIPVISYFLAREKAEILFESWKDWLIRNNQSILSVILLLLGIVLLSRGIEFSGLLTSGGAQ